MIDWFSSMQQTYEYYEVDPGTWKDVKPIKNITSCTINRDCGAETLGSASFDLIGSLPECYVRVYLVVNQNGEKTKVPLGTYLLQSPSIEFDGIISKSSVDAYTPLLEMKEKPMPIGYSVMKKTNILDICYRIFRENMRAPIIQATSDKELENDFISDPDETCLRNAIDLLDYADYGLGLDETGQVLFMPNQKTDVMQPVTTFDDGNSSILLPSITVDRDIYGIPNVVEVIVSRGRGYYIARAVNDDPNSPVSTVSRGREIVHRMTSCDLPADSRYIEIDEYAENMLKSLSILSYTLTFSHGFYPVRLMDCVRLNYDRAGLHDVKARIVNQSISCKTGCIVNTTATFTQKLWR